MSRQYHIQSENTKYYIISEDEKEGDTVATVEGKISIPEHSILTITPPLGEEIMTGTVRGVNGLYVALPKKPVTGDKLFWSKEPYLWEMRMVPGPKIYSTYEFTPAEGEDLYWYDKFGIGKVIEVKDGKDLVPPEPIFNLHMPTTSDPSAENSLIA